MEKEFGMGSKDSVYMLETGKETELMDMEHILGQMEIGMMENGVLAKSQGKEQTSLQMEINTLDRIKMESLMDMEFTFGRVAVNTKENSLVD
jgi:hypothetical protein